MYSSPNTSLDSPALAQGSSARPRQLTLALVTAGIVCRVVQYLWCRSFWVDEASLVLNIRTKTAVQLLGPLSYHQAAPPIFLLIERGLFRLTGGSELSLRLFPLLAGCASVMFFVSLAKRLLSPWVAVLATALFSFSDRLIWHGTEVKQYGIDVFVAVALTWIAVGSAADADRPARRFMTLCGAAFIALWLSYPCVLVFGGLSLALFTQMLAAQSSRIKTLALYAIGNSAVIVSFFLLLRLVVRVQQTQSLGEYWAEDFFPYTHALAWPGWLIRHLVDLCNYPVDPLGAVLLPCAILGGVWMMREGRGFQVAMLTFPLLLNFMSSAAARYPLDGKRLTVYLAPDVLLLGAAGLHALWMMLRRPIGIVAGLPAAALVAAVAASAAFHLVSPRYRGHVRPAAAFVREHAAADDAIFPFQPHEFQCYWPLDDPHVEVDPPPADEIHARRFWIVWSYPNARFRSHLDPVLKWADSFATRQLGYDKPGGCAFLYEINSAPPHIEAPDIATHHKTMSADPDFPPS